MSRSDDELRAEIKMVYDFLTRLRSRKGVAIYLDSGKRVMISDLITACIVPLDAILTELKE